MYGEIILCHTKKEENNIYDDKLTSVEPGPGNHIILLLKQSNFSASRIYFISNWDGDFS